ncbi:hypothetical protein [Burkholderia mayonis]|uniref:Uncharacterized protein n=1 Tax=Burkholderia mayonis TaxID=1385591 RepID=A0A1B4G1R9_9BURK|nr:hypothetical protein [Burkholderia mayonis]AOJ09876.1 hypothetical protein WS71_21605 [Burkholderia mayonis]KVE49384.1 hypothetical protein WS71_16670 [Burkholderia mayonis]
MAAAIDAIGAIDAFAAFGDGVACSGGTAWAAVFAISCNTAAVARAVAVRMCATAAALRQTRPFPCRRCVNRSISDCRSAAARGCLFAHCMLAERACEQHVTDSC